MFTFTIDSSALVDNSLLDGIYYVSFESKDVAGNSETINYQFAVNKEGLVVYYPFNGNANDEAGNGNDGVVYNAILTEDRFGNPDSAYSFPVTGQYIRAATTYGLPKGNEPRTMAAWIRRSNTSLTRPIIVYGRRDFYVQSTLQTIYKSPGNLALQFDRGEGGNGPKTEETIAINEWTHVAMTHDGTFIKLYINGRLDESATTEKSLNTDLNGSGGLYINLGQNYEDGSIDEVRIYNRALSDEEIHLMYENCNNMASCFYVGWRTNRSNIFFNDGNVGIGTDSPGRKLSLSVNGKIGATEVILESNSETWPDYVFDSSYTIRSLFDVEKYIQENGHLPDIPSAEEVGVNNSIDIGKMQSKLLQKVEELTLYVIEQNKKLENQNTIIENRQNKISNLKLEITELEHKNKR